MPYVVAAILVAAFGLARPSFAEEPTVTRATYDAYVGMFAMQQHLNSCERHAPAAIEQLRAEVASIRAANDAALRRLGPVADKWKLPGDRPIDEVLAHIWASTDAYYADAPVEVAISRCQNLLETLMASNKPLERTRER